MPSIKTIQKWALFALQCYADKKPDKNDHFPPLYNASSFNRKFVQLCQRKFGFSQYLHQTTRCDKNPSRPENSSDLVCGQLWWDTWFMYGFFHCDCFWGAPLSNQCYLLITSQLVSKCMYQFLRYQLFYTTKNPKL